MNEERTWPPCDICRKPVATKDGLLAVSMVEIYKAEERERKWEKKHPADPSETVTLTTEGAYAYRSVPWRWGHNNCLKVVINPYEIAAERFQSLGDALAWTLHLQESKRWLAVTNWEAIVRRLHKVPRP
jgi:hypothetical protein